MTIFRALSLVALVVMCTGCSSILAGTSQTITINTNPPGARCELTREGRIIGTVENTPGAVTLKKTKHDIDVVCKKEGFTDTKEFAESGTEGATFGNILLGGAIGWAIDSAAGADNKYPEVVTVNLVPASGVPNKAPARPAPAAASKSNVAANTPKASSDPAKRLATLKKMKADGLLTDEEYERKRGEILSEF
jgi:hypothetical protein